MRICLIVLLAALAGACGDADRDVPGQATTTGAMEMLDESLAARFAQLALDCVHREYPYKVHHVLDSDADARVPRELYPVFYGCFDWHSAVHGHWLLVRVLRLFPDADFAASAEAALDKSFTPDRVAGEVAYFEGRRAFERPYGLAWFLQLMAELREWDDPRAARWAETLAPLEAVVKNRLEVWIPDLTYPIRIGTHNQSAFAFALAIDWSVASGDEAFRALLIEKSREFHLDDTNCPLGYEPSGEDFLSPCLMVADLMRRILEPEVYGSGDWLEPGIVRDPTDGKLVHLDGVNLSRAWNLEAIADALPIDDTRRDSLLAAAAVHLEAGIAAVSDQHYSGSHWLASFAVYATTERWKQRTP